MNIRINIFALNMANVFVLGVLSIVVGIVVGVSIDPCDNPRPLGSEGKRSIIYDPGTCDGRLCDNYINQGVWYSLDGDTTGNRMPESCVPVWRCGTYIPIWMNGAHPTADNPGPIVVPVCAQFRQGGDCCAWRDSVQVKYCKTVSRGEYYVYQLRVPPYCDMAYCGGSGIYCDSDAAWNEIRQNCTAPKCPSISGRPVLSPPVISGTKDVTDNNGNSFTARRFSVKCTFTYQRRTPGDDGARFDVIFEAGGKGVAKFTIPSSSTAEHSVEMDESYLVGSLDRNLACKVSAYWSSPYPFRCTSSSDATYYGIQILNSNGNPITRIDVEEGERVEVRMRATFPVTNRGCFSLQPGTPCTPSHTFRIYSRQILLSNCTFQLSYDSPTSGPIILSPIPTLTTSIGASWPLYFAAENTLQTQSSICGDYKSTDSYVSVRDTKLRPYCKSWTDPNIYTFPPYGSNANRRSYTLYRPVGDFYLVRLASRNFEIQVRHYECTTSVVCNCGVMVREGNNILGIDACPQRASPLLIRYLIDAQNPGGYIGSLWCGWTIYLPSGIEVSVCKSAVQQRTFLNVHVTGLAVENYNGLCSYSGCSDDSQCDRLYRVPPEESLFQLSSSNEPKCKTSPVIPACDCSNGGSRNVPCYTPDQSNLVLTKYTCNQAKTRRKRDSDTSPSNGGNFVELNDLNNTRLDGQLPARELVWPTPNRGITDQQAAQRCNDALTETPTYNLCISKVNVTVIIEACMRDIQASEDLDFIDVVPQLLELFCLNAITDSIVTNNRSNPINNATQRDLEQFKDTVCPNGCSGKGTCKQSTCTCNDEYWAGTDCSIDRRLVPVADKVLSPVCDTRESTCTKAFMLATGAAPTGLVCRIRDSKEFTLDEYPAVNGQQVICNLPRSPVNSNDLAVNATTNHTWFLSLSHDKVNFSNELQFTIYDSLCYTCNSTTECLQKTSACNIGGRCYPSDYRLNCTEVMEVYCKPTICHTKWSLENSKSCDDGVAKCSSSTIVSLGYTILALVYVFQKAVAHRSSVCS